MKDLGGEIEKLSLRCPDSFGGLRTGSSALPQDDRVHGAYGLLRIRSGSEQQLDRGGGGEELDEAVEGFLGQAVEKEDAGDRAGGDQGQHQQA